MAIHQNLPVSKIPALGLIIRCPHCGQLEIWTHAEIMDHGICRTAPKLDKDGQCLVCGEKWHPGIG